jgi:hypothetical protein
MRHTQAPAPTPQELRLRGAVPPKFWPYLILLCLSLAVVVLPMVAWADPPLDAGPLYDEFKLTLDSGQRTEAAGPLFYDEQRESQHTWAVPPLLSYTQDPETEFKEFHFLYPIMTYDYFGGQYRWQFCQLLSFAGGTSQTESMRKRFTVFPVYFQQRSSDPSQDYTAFGPFYGHLQHRLMRDEIHYVMFPFYSETRKRDVVTDNYLYPIFHLRHGDGLHGWQFWPLGGAEHKDVTTRTNGFGDVTTIGGRDSFFVLWPLFFNNRNGIGTVNQEWRQASFPAYSLLRSPLRDSTGVLWPFFNFVDDRENKYREWDAPWPLVVFARGEGKTTSRVFPFFSQAHNATVESDFYLWPIYKYNAVHSAPLERRRTRICFYLYSDRTDKNTETSADRRRIDCWPFYVYVRDFAGNRRLQVLAPLEPFLRGSEGIERDWSPLWSLWRSEKNPKTGATSQSLLWNLYRREAAPTGKKCSLLFGLFQYSSGSEGKNMRVFYIPVSRAKAPAKLTSEPPKAG